MSLNNQLFLIMLLHVAMTAVLYAALTIARAPKIWEVGKRTDGSNPFAQIEPKISANLSNQFEWPMFFYAACIIAICKGIGDSTLILLAWIFIAGRLVHSLVQIFTSNIRLRGVVFTINFLAVIAMWVVLANQLLIAA